MTKDWIKDIPNWEKEYLTMEPQLTKRQRELSKAIKRARFLALMPYVVG